MRYTLSDLFTALDAYCAAKNLSESRVSTLMFGAGNRISALRNGGDIATRNLAKSMQWLSNNWPEGAGWPAEVPRPDPSQSGVE